jgi:uncharacterized membrane protein
MLIAGIVCLAVGFIAIAIRRQLSVLSRVLFAAPLAVFGVQHLTQPHNILQVVPAFVPFRIFWVYLVGIALVAAAASLALGVYTRLAGLLLGFMWLGFVLLIHIPNVVAQPSRFQAALVARDLSFGLAAWTLVGNSRLTTACRIGLAAIYLFFGVEHLLHPEFSPGVPLRIMTPEWIPLRPVWGYAVGVVLLATGVALVANRYARIAATCLGVAVTLVVLGLNVPALLADPHPFSAVQAIDVVFDTLLFAAGAFLLASALPVNHSQIPEHDRERRVAAFEADHHVTDRTRPRAVADTGPGS